MLSMRQKTQQHLNMEPPSTPTHSATQSQHTDSGMGCTNMRGPLYGSAEIAAQTVKKDYLAFLLNCV